MKAFDIVSHLADRIGARPAGSKNAALAVEWTTAQFRVWGIDVRNEPVVVPHWVRGRESASIVSHNAQPLVLTAFGGSVPTPPGGLVAGVVEVRSFEELGPHVGGKIVAFDNPMDAPTLAAYRSAAAFRVHGASRAAAHGAVAVLIRSAGSASLRTPHTGSVTYDARQPKIPGAALSAEDAMLVHRLIAAGDAVRIHLTLESAMLPDAESANVVAEIRGSERPDEIVLIGAHLDSWDLGTGAIDNASGVAMVMETMHRIRGEPHPPKRTIRCVLFMNEELGQSGSRAYFATHRDEQHIAAVESDMGAAAPRGFSTTLTGPARGAIERRLPRLRFVSASETGVDTAPFVRAGVPGFGLDPDPLHYFDFHHSAADTLDKIDADELQKCVDAVAELTRVLAEDGIGR